MFVYAVVQTIVVVVNVQITAVYGILDYDSLTFTFDRRPLSLFTFQFAADFQSTNQISSR